MDRPEELTDLQVELASVFFALDATEDYLVAGGAALLASDLIDRPTEDLDLFAATPTTSVTPAKDAFMQAGTSQTGLWRRHDPGQTHVLPDHRQPSGGGDRGRPRHRLPTAESTDYHRPRPTLAPLELAGRKLLALFGRAEARDFADVYRLVRRFGKDALIKQAQALDEGFDLSVLAQMVRTITRFDDQEIPLAADALPAVREFFADWAGELS